MWAIGFRISLAVNQDCCECKVQCIGCIAINNSAMSYEQTAFSWTEFCTVERWQNCGLVGRSSMIDLLLQLFSRLVLVWVDFHRRLTTGNPSWMNWLLHVWHQLDCGPWWRLSVMKIQCGDQGSLKGMFSVEVKQAWPLLKLDCVNLQGKVTTVNPSRNVRCKHGYDPT